MYVRECDVGVIVWLFVLFIYSDLTRRGEEEPNKNFPIKIPTIPPFDTEFEFLELLLFVFSCVLSVLV